MFIGHSSKQGLTTPAFKWNAFNSDLYSLKVIFLYRNNSLTPCKRMWSDSDKMCSLHASTGSYLSQVFNSAWECVCFEVMKSDKKVLNLTECKFRVGLASSCLSSFPIEIPAFWILPCDSRAISTYWFQHQEIVCLIWMKWLKLSRDEQSPDKNSCYITQENLFSLNINTSKVGPQPPAFLNVALSFTCSLSLIPILYHLFFH